MCVVICGGVLLFKGVYYTSRVVYTILGMMMSSNITVSLRSQAVGGMRYSVTLAHSLL